MKARGGYSEAKGVVGKFRVSGRNEDGRKLIELCTKKKLSEGNMLFEKKYIHKFT